MALLLLWIVGGTGCHQEDPIVRYEVPKEESIQLPVSTDGAPTSVDAPTFSGEPTHRMLAAVILQGNRAWFFKATGSLDQVSDEIAGEFESLIGSLRFDEESPKPAWDLPAGWSEHAASSSMRVADLRVGEVEFSVTPLGFPGNERSYILSNVNRWRRQLRLPPLTPTELAQDTYEIATADGREAIVVDLQGRLDVSSLPPMARSPAAGPAGAGPTAGPAPRFGENKLQYETPDGWQEQPARQMRKAAFLVTEGDQQVEVTVIALSGSAGGLLANANRWRGEVGLEELPSVKDLAAEKIEIDGSEGTYLRIEGTEGQAILAAILPRDGQVWFFKLKGDQSLADQQQEAFHQFLASVRFAS